MMAAATPGRKNVGLRAEIWHLKASTLTGNHSRAERDTDVLPLRQLRWRLADGLVGIVRDAALHGKLGHCVGDLYNASKKKKQI